MISMAWRWHCSEAGHLFLLPSLNMRVVRYVMIRSTYILWRSGELIIGRIYPVHHLSCGLTAKFHGLVRTSHSNSELSPSLSEIQDVRISGQPFGASIFRFTPSFNF